MLYYLVPPLIIIVGLAILISFIVRKVSRLPQDQLFGREQEESPVLKVKKIDFSKFSYSILHFLEKLAQWFKILFLKFHNSANRWFYIIRQKRKKSMAGQEELAKKEFFETIATKEEDELMAKTRVTEPILAKKFVLPEHERAKARNKLEEVLIERIAANPRDIEAYERLGDYYMEREIYKDAWECFKQVLKLSPVHRRVRIKIKKLEKILKK